MAKISSVKVIFDDGYDSVQTLHGSEALLLLDNLLEANRTSVKEFWIFGLEKKPLRFVPAVTRHSGGST